LADRAIDLPTGIAGVALDMLAALRAEEFEFSHDFIRPCGPASAMTHAPMVFLILPNMIAGRNCLATIFATVISAQYRPPGFPLPRARDYKWQLHLSTPKN